MVGGWNVIINIVTIIINKIINIDINKIIITITIISLMM